MTTRDVLDALKARHRAHVSCSPGCPGWAVFEVNRPHLIEIEACEDCNSIAEDHGLGRLTDDDVCDLPVARRALADALLTDNGRTRRPRAKGRQLYNARARVLREHDLCFALSLTLMWCEARRDDPERHSAEYALMQIEGVANAALGVEEASG